MNDTILIQHSIEGLTEVVGHLKDKNLLDYIGVFTPIILTTISLIVFYNTLIISKRTFKLNNNIYTSLNKSNLERLFEEKNTKHLFDLMESINQTKFEISILKQDGYMEGGIQIGRKIMGLIDFLQILKNPEKFREYYNLPLVIEPKTYIKLPMLKHKSDIFLPSKIQNILQKLDYNFDNNHHNFIEGREDYIFIGTSLSFSKTTYHLVNNQSFGDFIKSIDDLMVEIEKWLKNPVWSSPILDLVSER
jgi:hypothetical protein